MKNHIIIGILAAMGMVVAGYGQNYTFHTVLGSSSTADGALDEASIADHLKTANYTGQVGEMGLIFADQAPFASISGTPSGSFRGDTGDTYGGQFGMIAYCVDSDAPFNGTNGVATKTLTAYTVAAAEARYMNEVSYYLPGSLKRAAYLLETFGQAAHDDTTNGNNAAAAMQVAIWESLYDSTVSVTEGNGNYYVRTSYGTSTMKATTTNVRDRANAILDQAVAANWGGASYNPGNRVVVWMDPNNASAFQSILSFRAPGVNLIMVPEPASVGLAALGALALVLRRRR